VIHDFQGVITFGMAFFILLGEGRLIDALLVRAGIEPAPGDAPDVDSEERD
jgi:hypothetical protein